jgi:hypothetical protein
MATFEVDIGGATYEVDAPDENTAWAWANQTHASEKPKLDIGQTAKNFGKGLLSGTADIGDTLIDATGKLPIARIGGAIADYASDGEYTKQNEQRKAGLEGFNKENEGTAFNLGRIGGNIAGTAGVGGGAGAALALASKTPRALALANAIKTGGMGAGSLGTKVAGGATQGALGSLLIDPSKESAGTGAVIGSAFPVVGASGPKLGGMAADLIGNLGTHTGGESLRTAANSGMRGGNIAKAFTDNMRGNVPMEDVLTSAKQNIQNMGAQKSDAYRAGMADISNDKSVLQFDGIDKSLEDALSKITYKGQVKNKAGADVFGKMQAEIAEWKSLDPAEYHTPEGLDALKQKIGGLVESIPYEEKTARSVGREVYNSIKNEITKQAPTYAKTMKEYSDSTELISEIEKALSLGNKASADTAMRKLQSLTRNNVSTNYGNRLDLAKALEQQGGNEIMPALAGQSLSSIAPRGLGGAVAGATGVGGIATMNPLAIPALALQSPRLMGEAAYKTGQTARGVKKASGGLSKTAAAIAAALQR